MPAGHKSAVFMSAPIAEVLSSLLQVASATLRLHSATLYSMSHLILKLCTKKPAVPQARTAIPELSYCAEKMLMNIAVQQGAAEGMKFIEYVSFLADKGFVPPNGKHWVDHIRKKGNEATHEIAIMSEQDAKDLIAFIEMLLRFIYEFPSMVPTQP